MRKFFSVILLFICISSSGQQATGTVKGRVVAGKEALESASVALLKTTFAVAADSNGNFIISNVPAGKYQLRVTYIGYENYQEEVIIGAGKITEVKAELISLTAQLDQVIVTGTMKEASKLESVTPVDVYTAKYFQRDPSNNLWESMNMINGVFADVDNGVSNTGDIQINGIEGNYTSILIDGVPSMNGLAGIYALNAFPMGIIDKVEVVKGASSTLYGSDAMAGVVNIITKNPDQTPTFYANVYLTSYLETNADFSASFKLKNVSSVFSVSTVNMNTRWDYENDGFTDIPLVNRVNYFNKWSINRKDNKVATVYARYLFDNRWGGQMNTPGQLVGSNQYYTQWVRTNQWQAGFQYQLPVKEKVILMADYSEFYQNAFFGTFYYTGRQRTVFTQLNWTKKVGINDLLLGVNYRMKYYVDNTTLSNDYITGTSPASHIAGAFMEDEISMATGHKLILGCRFDYNNRYGPVATPRLNYKWNSRDQSNVFRFGFGTGYRVPDLLNDGYGAMTGARAVYIPVKLIPEQDLTLNTNYTRVQKLPGGILDIDLSAFYTFFMSYIDPDYSVNGLVMYYNSKNGLNAPGCSANADFTFNFPLKIGVGVTYADVWEVDTVNGKRVRDPTQHAPHLTSNFFFSYSFPDLKLSLDWTGQILSPMLLVTEDNDYRPAESPWCSLQNIQITKKFKNGIEVYGGVKNFFDFLQKDPLIRANDPFNRSVNVNNPYGYVFDAEYGFTTSEGIKGFVGLRYTFH